MKRMMMSIWLGLLLAVMTVPAAGGICSLDAADGSPIQVVYVDANGNTRVSGSLGVGTGTHPSTVQLDVTSGQGLANNSAIRATYPGGGSLAGTEFGALAHRNGAWSAVYAKQGAASYAAYLDGKLQVAGDVIISKGLSPQLAKPKLDVDGTISGTGYKLQSGGAIPGTTSVAVSSGYLGEGGIGVHGRAEGTDGLAVFGSAEKNATIGVKGEATNTASVTNYGGYFLAKGGKGTGIYGQAEGSLGCGVEGRATSTGADVHYGGFFRADGAKGIGLQGEALGTQAVGVRAKSGGIALYAEAMPGGVAGEFVGNVKIRSIADKSVVIELGEGLDYAEGFDVSEKTQNTPGLVLVINADNPGKLTLSTRAYDTRVAGIVAGGKDLGSGVRLGGHGFDCNVALAGRVYCNVDASNAGIEPGDLLTTSAKPGYAMKVQDHVRAQGAILGKAMERLEKGQQGQVLVLVTLQ